MSQNNVVPLVAPTDETRDALRAVMENNKISQARIAKETGFSGAVISQWLAGVYPGDVAAVAERVNRWLTAFAEAQANETMMPAAPSFVPTPTAQRVTMALGYAQMAGDIALIYGGAGLGKTTALRSYSARSLNCWIATMTPASSSVQTALSVIATACGLSAAAGGGANALHIAICAKVRATNGLLIIDEAQHLGVPALDQIRSIHDETGIGIALVGNEQVHARMVGGQRAPYLDRLYSRIGKRVFLKKPTQGDVDALIAAWSITDGECRAQMTDIALKPGGLRSLTKVLRLASMSAASAGRAICCTDVRASWKELGGDA